jgi:hypothetical protein
MWWIGYTNQRDAFDCRDDGYAVARPFVGTAMFTSGGASGLFSNWNARADLEDARNVVIDQATIAAQMHAPEIAARYLVLTRYQVALAALLAR